MSANQSDEQDTKGLSNLPVPAAGAATDNTTDEIKARGSPNGVSGDNADNRPESSWFHRLMRRKFPDASPHEHWNLLFTAVIAFSTFVYMAASIWTLWEIHSSGADTHSLARAATTEAEAAVAQVNPLVHPSEWMAIYHLEPEKKILAHVKVQNDGKTPGQMPAIAIRMQIRATNPSEAEYRFKDGDYQRLDQSESMPPFDFMEKNARFVYKYMDGDYSSFIGQDVDLYVWGKTRYWDYAGKSLETPFCRAVPLKEILSYPAGRGSSGYQSTVYRLCN